MDKADILYQKLASVIDYVQATKNLVPGAKALFRSQKAVSSASREHKAAKKLWELHGGRTGTHLGVEAANIADKLRIEKKLRKMLLKQTGKGLVIPGAGLAVGTAGVVATNN